MTELQQISYASNSDEELSRLANPSLMGWTEDGASVNWHQSLISALTQPTK